MSAQSEVDVLAPARLSVLDDDVWSWDVKKIEQYTIYLRYQAGQIGKVDDKDMKKLSDTIVFAYDTLIKPCFSGDEKKIGPYQWKLLPSTDPTAPNVLQETVDVHDNVGPLVLLTDFYSCFGWMIGILETEIHQHANAQEHDFCKRLVLRFAKLCHVMHEGHFKKLTDAVMESMQLTKKVKKLAQTAPAQAYILYGESDVEHTEHIPIFNNASAATLSTSLPSTAAFLTGNVWMRGMAQSLIAELVYREIKGVEELVQATVGLNGFPIPGNCAEWRTWASRLRPKVTLFGYCVNIKLVSECTDLDEAMDPKKEKCGTRACPTCATILKFRNEKCEAFDYTDMAPLPVH